jgi:hypothetical protein
MKQVLTAIILIFFFASCKSVPNIIGKWETNYRGKTKIISEFKKDGTVEVNSFPADSTIKSNVSPLLFDYSIYRENKKWHLKFIDSQSEREILSPLELKGNDTLITYNKTIYYEANDTIVKWEKDIFSRIK